MFDSLLDVLMRLSAAVWVGLAWGLLSGGWGEGPLRVALVSGGLGVAFAWLGWASPASDAAAEVWEDLSFRDRSRVSRALRSGKDPSDPRLARITRTVRPYFRGESVKPWRRDLALAGWIVFLVAVVSIAAFSGAPPGWVVAGALLPVASFAVRVVYEVKRAQQPRPTSS